MSALPRTKRDESDGALVQRLNDGDLSALGEIYDRHAEDVRRFVLRATSRRDVADDVTHDAFLGLVGAAKRYDGSRPLRAYVLGIAGKLLLRRRRHLAVTSRILNELGNRLRRTDYRDPERLAVADEDLSRFLAVLETLSPAKRVTLILSDVEGLSGPEIAEALDIPVATVWTRLHHARAEVRGMLGEGKTS